MNAKRDRAWPSRHGAAVLAACALAVAAAAACSPRNWDVTLTMDLGGRGPGGGVDGGARGGAAEPSDGGATGGRGGFAGREGGHFGNGFGGHDPFGGAPGSGGSKGSGGFSGGGSGAGPCPALKAETPDVLFLVDRSQNTNARTTDDEPWWRAENEALMNVVNQYGPPARLAYRAFPTSSMGCNSNDLWKGMASDLGNQIANCSTGSCVQMTTDAPLNAALQAAARDLNGNDPTDLFPYSSKVWVVVLLGSTPTCTSCTNLSGVTELAKHLADTVVIPFGSSLETSGCLSPIQQNTTMPPTSVAHSAASLAETLATTMKEIVTESQCSFIGYYPGLTSLRLRIGANEFTFSQGNNQPWVFTDYYGEIRFIGDTCQMITKALAQKQAVSVVPVNDACSGRL
jgi:hypothetical protein